MSSFTDEEEMYRYSSIPPPPIFDLILAARNPPNRGRAPRYDFDTAFSIIEFYRTQYISFLLHLNRHIYQYGETGFSLDSKSLIAMESIGIYGGLSDTLKNTPTRLQIRAESVFKFLTVLPTSFEPTERVLHQIKVESEVSGGLQFCFQAYKSLRRRIIQDGMQSAISPARAFKLVCESGALDEITQKILMYSVGSQEIHRMNLESLRLPAPDDYYSVFFDKAINVVSANEYFFSMARDIVYSLRLADIPEGADYMRRSSTGVISDNSFSARPDALIRMSRREFELNLNGFKLFSTIIAASKRGSYILLPFPIPYREKIVTSWEPEEDAWKIILPATQTGFGYTERIEIGKFCRQILTPQREGPQFPDVAWQFSTSFKFWKGSSGGIIRPTSFNNDVINMIMRVTSYREMVIFRSVFDLMPLSSSGPGGQKSGADGGK